MPASPSVPRITIKDFLTTVAYNKGEVLATSGGRATFRLGMSGKRVTFTPVSSNQTRPLNNDDVQRYLDIFNRTRSTRTSDYTENMYNASYVLAIIQLWLGQHSNAESIDDGTGKAGGIDPEFSAPEGDTKVRLHRHRERSRELVNMAKRVFWGNHNRFFCEVCDFDFGKIYGTPDFIEVHHRIPLRDLQPGAKTKLSDLAMVCANCHRMLHRGNPWPTMGELKKKIAASRTSRHSPASKLA